MGFFNSKSFAVIGASREKDAVGHVIFKNLVEKVKTYPINPNANEILGKKCYKSILDIEKVDCCVIAVPAKIVPRVLEEIGKKGIKNVVIISAGFEEAGNSDYLNKIKIIVEKYSLNVLGPNSLGFINPYLNVNASFYEGMPEKGNIAFLSQSGAIGTAVLDEGIKLSSFVSLGNSNFLGFSEAIEYFSKDKDTEVIALYIESLRGNEGEKFIKAVKDCKKPIIALKAGKTESGKKAALSHTAALASEQGVYEGIFKQIGIKEVDSIRQLMNLSKLYSKFKNLGKKACIVTNAGGPGVLISDALKNINLPNLPVKIIEKLNFLPDGWSKTNPVDMLGDAMAGKYKKTIEVLDKEDFFDFFIVLLTPQYMTRPLEIAKTLINLKTKKPIIPCFLGGKQVSKAREILKENYLVFDEIKDVADCLNRI